MLATDLRGLRNQCQEEEKAYQDDLARLEELRAAIKELDLKPAMDNASQFVEEARERCSKMTQEIHEALADLEELDSSPSDCDAMEAEILELQSSREQFERARQEDEARAAAAERETKELLEERSRLEAQISDARAECKALVDEAAQARREAAAARALPKPVEQPVVKREPDAIKMRALERRVGLRLLRATMRSWRQLMVAFSFRRELTTRLAAEILARWRRYVAASRLAEAASSLAASRRAIRAWCAYTAESRRFRELERRADEIHRAAKFRRFAKKVLRKWHRVAAYMQGLRKVAEWQRRKLAQAVIDMRRAHDDWPELPTHTGRRAICSDVAAHEVRQRDKRAEAVTLLVDCLTRAALRTASWTWSVHAKQESRRLSRMATGLAGLRRFRDFRMRCRTLGALAQAHRVRKCVRRWAARTNASKVHAAAACMAWQARHALRRLQSNIVSRCARNMLRRVARVHRTVRLKRRCFAAWFVERLRSRAALALEASMQTGRLLEEAQNREVGRVIITKAATVEARDRSAREAELESELRRTNEETSQILLAVEATRKKVAATRAAIVAARAERARQEDRAAAACAAAAAAAAVAVAASEEAQKEQRERLEFIEEQRRVCQKLAAEHPEAMSAEVAAGIIRDITNGDVERACSVVAKVNEVLASRMKDAKTRELEARAERDRLECEIADLSQQLETARAEAKIQVNRQIDEVRQQYEANARAQIQLAQQKSEAHLALRVKNIVKAMEIKNPSEHLKCSLLEALRARRDYLRSRREKASEQEDAVVVDPTDFYAAVQRQLEELEEPALPPLPPLRESEETERDDVVQAEKREGEDSLRSTAAAARPQRRAGTMMVTGAESRRRRRSRPSTMVDSSGTTSTAWRRHNHPEAKAAAGGGRQRQRRGVSTRTLL